MLLKSSMRPDTFAFHFACLASTKRSLSRTWLCVLSLEVNSLDNSDFVFESSEMSSACSCGG